MDRRKVGRPTSWRSPARQPGFGNNVAKFPVPDSKTGSFDQWLDHRLKEMYGAVVEEPLPDELKELVDRLSEEDDTSAPAQDASGRNKPND